MRRSALLAALVLAVLASPASAKKDPPKPAVVEDADWYKFEAALAQYQALNASVQAARLEAQALEQKLPEAQRKAEQARVELRKKYQLGDADDVDASTRKIVRR